MSWSTLEVNVDDIKVRESKLFGTWTDSAVKGVMKSVAKEQMKRDMCDELGLGLDDTAIDTLADDYTTDLQRALAYLQLHLFFMDNHTGDGSVNAMKASHYASLYKQERQRFKTLGGTATSTSTHVMQAWR